MRRLKRIGGLVLLLWSFVRLVPDTLESVQATAKYSEWVYRHLSAPRGELWTIIFVVLGAGLVFSETIQKFLHEGFFERGLVGEADLMLQELDLSDITIVDGGASYAIDLAAFVRMEVASVDKPRTVKRFEIDLVAPDGAVYRANSEYEVGDYDRVHDVSKKDSLGISRVERVREPMDDLAKKLRTPIQPSTHVGRAWVRFEIAGVKRGHEPRNCRIRIFAVDPSDKRHEMTTDHMQVMGIDDDREYAVARGQ